MNDPWMTQQNDVAEATTIVPEAQPLPAWLTEDIRKALENGSLPLTSDGMLLLWQRSEAHRDHWKATEMEYRKICAGFLVPAKTEGVNNVEIGNGYVAKVGIKFNYNLLNDNDKVWAGLEKIEALGNEGKFVAERLVSWKPSFLLTEYRQLQEDDKKGSKFAADALRVIDEILEITNAAPTLAINEPKKAKTK